jgi:predicted transcriptional regulator
MLLFPIIMYATERTTTNVLENDIRKKIITIVSKNPGTCLTDIMDELDIKTGHAQYHLGVLEREGYVRSVKTGIYRRIYLQSKGRNS